MMNQVHWKSLFIALFAFGLTACGGGGSDSSNPNPAPPPVTPAPVTWQPGVFPDSETLIARCESPRSGIDPFTNEAFPDRQGSAFEEKMWLRSWTDETYLWFDEVEDNNPDNFSIQEYFLQLKTNEITASGRAKDNFHFSQNTAEYNALTQSGVSSGYGFNFAIRSSSVPREYTIRYTEPNSPAALNNVPRGAVLSEIDGIDFINTMNETEFFAAVDALFPENSGSTHQFTFVLVDGSVVTYDLTSEIVELNPVQQVNVYQTDAGRMGYMLFNRFITPSQQSLIDAFEFFENEGINELAIDLRYNGGGSLNLASQIGYMIAGPSQTSGRLFNTLQTNGKFQNNDEIPFYTREIDYEAGVFTNRTLPSPQMTRVFILSTGGTCSASESVINALRGIDVEVVLIGDTTCGKPFGFFPQDNCGTTYFTIQIQSVNDKGFGAYQDGFRPVITPNFDDELPGCRVADDLTSPLAVESEPLLATAIHYLENGSCPVTVSTQKGDSLNQIDAARVNAQQESRNLRRDVILKSIAQETYIEIREP